MRLLIQFDHGLGDTVQLGIVLQHLAKHRPNCLVDVATLHGKHTALRGLASHVYSDQNEQPRECDYDQIVRLSWFECNRPFEHVPNTKPALCLHDVFQIEPEIDLFRYKIRIDADARQKAADYLREVTGADPVNGRYNAAVIHYQGNTSADKKNMRHDAAAEICQAFLLSGLKPIILDWDRRSPLPDNRDIFCPAVGHSLWGGFGSGDAATIAALVEQSRLFVGVDSGPLHVAGSTSTPVIGVWSRHHPVKYFDIAPNVTHLVAKDWRKLTSAQGAAVFERHYRFREQSDRNLAADICDLADELLGIPLSAETAGKFVRCRGFWVRRDNVAQDLVIVDDVYHNDCYKLAIIPDTIRNAQLIVDVGAHIGCFARKVHEINPRATIVCVEACPENLEALKANVGSFAEIVEAACTYEPGELGLLNAVRPNCTSTGGSRVVPADQVAELAEGEYWPDRRGLQKITLEQIMDRFGAERIDLLKLDCEGSEFSILRNADVNRIEFAVGEYHNHDEWEILRAERLASWDYGHMSRHDALGNFHLRNTHE